MTRQQAKPPKAATPAVGGRRLEQRLQAEDEQIPSMIGYWDRGLLNRFGNQAYAQWFGLDPATMAGMHIRDVIGEERYRFNLPYIEAALRGEEQQFERIIPVPGGKTPRIGLAQYVPDIFNGEVQGFYALVSDITAKKETEASLREKQDQLHGLYKLSTRGIVMADMSGRFIEFNEAFRKMCGYSAEELKALDYWKLTPEKYLAAEPAHIETLISTGRYGPYEKEYIRKDGSLVAVSLTGVLITGSDDQRYIWSIVEDITERKLTMEKLQLFEQCIARANDVIVITEAEPIDVPGNLIVFVNDAYERTTGYSREEALGNTPRMLQGPKTDRSTLDRIRQALSHWQPVREEVLNYTKTGQEFWSELEITPVANASGWFTHWISIQRDITERKRTEAELRESERALNEAQALAQIGSYITDLSTGIWQASPTLRQIFGIDSSFLTNIENWGKLMAPGYEQKMLDYYQSVVHGDGKFDMDYEIIRPCDGERRWVHALGQFDYDADGKPLFLRGTIQDITERKQVQEALAKSGQRLELALESGQMGAWDLDLANDSSWRSARHDQIFGYSTPTPHWNRKILFDHIAPEDRKRVFQCFDEALRTQHLKFECQILWPDQSRHWIFAQGQVLCDEQGRPAHMMGIVLDLTKRKLAEQRIENLAYFDTLTGLPNRRLLQDRLQHALLSSVRQHHIGALLLVDLDNFKTLNDTLGHQQGDLLLQQVAARLKDCVRECDTVARLGSDEFIVVLEELGENALHAATQAAMVAEKILRKLGERYEFGGWAHSSTASIGITLFGDQSESAEAPMVRADLAMHKAKEAGRNTLCYFDSQMQIDMVSAVVLEEDLRHALQSEQFCVYYQAQVAGGKEIVGVEALLRWQHPVRGWVSPAEFIPSAEKTGLILPLGLWVLETACKQLALWALRAETAQITIAVNVSARQFRDSDFVDQVLATLQRTGAKAHLLKLELTESVLVANVDDVASKMNTLKAAGIRFSLDDFGTGYSSLSVLKRLPLDQLKIDQSFVRNILADPNDAAIARMVIALANSLELAVIAEGVETEAQRDCLAAMGCPNYQGYLFARPLPVPEFEALVARTGGLATTHS
jgi:diguanylate cyclase (GGDEF)-like protein/PAS domain S-box-containing protein